MKKRITTDKYDDNEKLEPALEYQDFVVDLFFRKFGLTIMSYASMLYQNTKGETKCGWEIKGDWQFRKTGNFYIEYAEKRKENNKLWVKSGIMRRDNSWLYLIGDYDDIYIFSKRQLIEEYKKCYGRVQKTTSKGFLLPVNSPLLIHKISVHHGEIDEYKKDDLFWK